MVSTYPTESFNPTFCVRLDCIGDYHDFTLKEAIEQLLIYDNLLIKKKHLEAIRKKYGESYDMPLEANLRNLLNQEMIQEAPEEWYAYYVERKWKE